MPLTLAVATEVPVISCRLLSNVPGVTQLQGTADLSASPRRPAYPSRAPG